MKLHNQRIIECTRKRMFTSKGSRFYLLLLFVLALVKQRALVALKKPEVFKSNEWLIKVILLSSSIPAGQGNTFFQYLM